MFDLDVLGKRAYEDSLDTIPEEYPQKMRRIGSATSHEYHGLSDMMSNLSIRRYFWYLSPELRNQVYRMVFEGDESIVMVDSNRFPEPPLLSVCKKIRYEAGSIYYSEHVFRIANNYNTEPQLILFYKIHRVLSEFVFPLQYEYIFNAVPNWRDLIQSLRRDHSGHLIWDVYWTSLECSRPLPASDGYAIVEGMLCTTRDLRDLPWDRVEPILERSHSALVAIDARWA